MAYSVNALRLETCILHSERASLTDRTCSFPNMGGYAWGTSASISTPSYPIMAIFLIESLKEYFLNAFVLKASFIMLMRFLIFILWLPCKLRRLAEKFIGVMKGYFFDIICTKSSFFSHFPSS